MLLLCLINPRRMREGYGSLCVYLSVTTLAATYLVFTLKIRCHRVLYGIFNVWLLLKILMLCSKFWHHLLTTVAFLAP